MRKLLCFAVVAAVLACANGAIGAVTLTTTTGGLTISADATGGATYTNLTGPICTEGATADIGTGTIVLNAPGGFEFDIGGTAPTVLMTRVGGNGNPSRNINGLASGSTIALTSISSSALTITITSSGNNGVTCSLTWQNVRVRPTAGTPLASGSITNSGTASISGLTSSSVWGSLIEVVGAANAAHSTIAPSSASLTADGSSTQVITVQSRDVHNNNLTTGGGTVVLSKTGGGTLSSVTDNGNGTYTATLTAPTTTGSATITATLGGTSVGTAVGASSSVVTYVAGAANAAHSTVSPATATISADGISTQVILVTARDVNDNNLTTGAATVVMSKTGGGTLSSVTDNGNGTYSATLTAPVTAGSATITATLNGTAVGTAVGASSSVVTFSSTAADAAHSTVNPATASITANGISSQVITVQARDASDNNLATGGATVVLSKTGGGTLGSVTDNGNGTYTAMLTAPTTTGSATITATLNGTAVGTAVGATNSVVTFTPGAIDHYVVSASSPQTAGAAFNVTITAQDNNNNTVTTDSSTVVTMTGTGSVQFDSDGNGTFGDITKTLSSGAFTISSKDNVAETITITATSAGPKTGTTSNIVINAAAASQLAFVQQPTTTIVGATISPAVTVQVRDSFGNNVSSNGVSVVMTLGSGTGTLSGTTTRTTSAGGLATFNDLSIDLNGAKQLTASSSPLAAANSSFFNVNCASLSSSGPANQTNCPSTTAGFTTVASGTGPFTYQWLTNGTALAGDGKYSGTNGSSLSVSNVSATDAVTYTVVVTDLCGASVTNNAALTVNTVTTATPLSNQTNCPGTSAIFSTTASGTGPFSHVWRFNGNVLAGEMGSSFTTNNVSAGSAGTYTVEVTGACGSATNSADLTVLTNTSASALTGLTNCPGSSATFSTTASGTGPFSYVWRFNGNVLAGEMGSSFTTNNVSAGSAGTYTVEVTGACGSATNGASLTVLTNTSATPLSNHTNCPGTTASFSTVATGTGPFVYQWFTNGVVLADSDKHSGTSTSSLLVSNVTTADEVTYSVVASGVCGSTSNYATLTIGNGITATALSSLTNCEGTSASFSTTPSGGGPYTYVWSKDGSVINGATNNSFTTNSVTVGSAGNYCVAVISGCGNATNCATLTVNPSTTATPLTSQTNCPGTSATFSTTASGTAPFTYVWKKNGSVLIGENNDTFTTNDVTGASAGVYTVEVTGACGSVTNNATLTVISTNGPMVVTISSPAANFRTNNTFTITGTVKSTKRVDMVLYKIVTDSSDVVPSVTNWIETSYTPAVGTTNWSATVDLPRPGTNTFYVKSVDACGNESKVLSRKFFLTVSNALNVVITGNGSLNPVNFTNVQLEIGRIFTVTALPGSNYLFTNWTVPSSVLTANAKLTFRMTSNLVLYATFITNRFIGAAGNYYGLFSDTNGIAHESAGFFAIKTDSKLKFSGRLYLDGDTLAIGGTFNQAGVGTLRKLVTRKDRTPLDVVLNLNLGGGDSVSGTVSNAVWLADLLGDRAVFNSTSNPATNFAGSYTAILPGSATPGLPAGDGYEIISVANNGTVKVKGYVADAVSHSVGIRANGITTGISKNGMIPFYTPLYLDRRSYGLVPTFIKTFDGMLMGWLSLTNATVTWIKQDGWTNDFYTDGFTNDVMLELSPYSPPPTPVLNISSGSLIFQDGNLLSPLTNNFTLVSSTNKPKFVMTAPTETKSLKVTLATGELKGFFTNPINPSVVTTIRGAILQNQNIGRGFFAGTNLTGSILVQ